MVSCGIGNVTGAGCQAIAQYLHWCRAMEVCRAVDQTQPERSPPAATAAGRTSHPKYWEPLSCQHNSQISADISLLAHLGCVGRLHPFLKSNPTDVSVLHLSECESLPVAGLTAVPVLFPEPDSPDIKFCPGRGLVYCQAWW